jgi:signal transduction histidine kinase
MVWTTSTCEQGLVVSSAEGRRDGKFLSRLRFSQPFSRLRVAPSAALLNGLVLAGFAIHWVAHRSPSDPLELAYRVSEGVTFSALLLAGLATSLLMGSAETSTRAGAEPATDDTAGGALFEPPHLPEPLPNAETQFVGLMAEMSHELRTPLNIIIGFSDMMQRELLGPLGVDRYKSYAGHIRESGFALVKAVDDTLALTRLMTNADRVPLAPVAINAILRSAVQYAAPDASEGRVHIRLVDGSEQIVIAERAALDQAFSNLLQAAALSAPQDATIDIACSRERRSVSVTLTVSAPLPTADDCTGDCVADATVPACPHGSSRLRRAIARALIELQGGRLEEHIYPDGSLVNRITLPSGAH